MSNKGGGTMRTFFIAQILNVDLMSRLLAQDFYNYIKNTSETDITIDFTGVNFATRSFMDEFYSLFLKPSNKEFEVKIANMPSDIEAILNAVKSTQNTKKQMTNATVIKAETLADVDKCFMALSI